MNGNKSQILGWLLDELNDNLSRLNLLSKDSSNLLSLESVWLAGMIDAQLMCFNELELTGREKKSALMRFEMFLEEYRDVSYPLKHFKELASQLRVELLPLAKRTECKRKTLKIVKEILGGIFLTFGLLGILVQIVLLLLLILSSPLEALSSKELAASLFDTELWYVFGIINGIWLTFWYVNSKKLKGRLRIKLWRPKGEKK